MDDKRASGLQYLVNYIRTSPVFLINQIFDNYFDGSQPIPETSNVSDSPQFPIVKIVSELYDYLIRNYQTSERFCGLVNTADFVIESFEPEYMAGLGLGYDTIRQIKPDIIMTSITPFGQTGPYAHYRATDLTLTGMGGMMRLYGDPDRPPVRISIPQAFFLGSLHGALGSVVAHYHHSPKAETASSLHHLRHASDVDYLLFKEFLFH